MDPHLVSGMLSALRTEYLASALRRQMQIQCQTRYRELPVPHDRIARHAVISKSPDSWQLSSRQKQSAQTPHRVRSRKSVKNVSKADSTIGCCSGTPQAMRDDRDHAPMVHARRSPRTVRPGRIFARENARDITAGGLCCKRKSYRPRKSCDGSSNPPSATFPLCVLFLRLPQRLREHNAQ